MIHALKQMPGYYDDVISGKKTFEVRKNDRPYKEGDLLALNEYDSENGYTGRSCLVYIDYILNDSEYCKDGYIVMSIKPCLVGFAGSPRDLCSMCENYSVPEVENISERRFR
jgi:hypothetical protein